MYRVSEYNTDRMLLLGGNKMQLLSVFLFSLSANIDSFTVGLAYGISGIRIDYKSNLLIAIITSLGTFISMAIGLFIKEFISSRILSLIGCILLVSLGILIIVKSFENRKLDEENTSYSDILVEHQKKDENEIVYIDIKESIALGLALSLNNFGLGIGASTIGINIYLTTIVTFILSILCILFGVKLGKKYLSKRLKQYADVISGLIIIFLGLYEFFI